METLWEAAAGFWLLIDEPLGTILGFVIVICLIRQNLWAWPLGVAYVVVSVSVLWEARLYANLALHVLGFLPLNLYGWYYWLFGSHADQTALPVTTTRRPTLLLLLGLGAAATLALGAAFAAWTDAAYPYWDNGLFVGSLIAMWLTARKKIENWLVWFAVDVVSVGVYWLQGLPLYAGLYFVYLAMAVAGWREWQRSMVSHAGAAAGRSAGNAGSARSSAADA